MHQEIKKIFGKYRELLALAAYVLLILILIFVVMMPLMQKINSVNDQIQEDALDQDIKRGNLVQLPKMKDQYLHLQDQKDKIDVLADKNNAIILIEKLEDVAQSSGCKIEISAQNQQIQKVPTNKPTSTSEIIKSLPSGEYIQMNIDLTGKYSDIFKFVSELENLQFQNDVIGIQVSSVEKKQPNNLNQEALNPFSKSKSISNTINNSEDIKTSLNVVFYTK